MSWDKLNLWSIEEKKINQCLTEALKQLIISGSVQATDAEKVISGKLHPLLKRIRRSMGLEWVIDFEGSVFENEDDAEPFGHPDIRFSRIDPDHNQYDYDVECKLVRDDPATDYCYKYVTNGILRYYSKKYAQSSPPMGTILGYIQQGDVNALLGLVNTKIGYQNRTHNGIELIILSGGVSKKDVSSLKQKIKRQTNEEILLTHLWADFS